MVKSFWIIVFLLIVQCCDAQPVRTGSAGESVTPQYREIMTHYNKLAASSRSISIKSVGPTDTEQPLSVVFYSGDGNFSIRDWKQANKVIILINNGIHPGEPDGIVASMQLLKDAADGKVKIPSNVVLAVVPVFNISGLLNMRKFTRANQNGPEVTGFRGNAQNLDLNRDFIKMDALETGSMIKLFHMLDPDILLDNHVSNGADYQHVMTLLSTQHNKLGGPMGKYLNQSFEPQIYSDMKTRGYSLVPYVNVWGTTPDSGWNAFLELPRFYSGFAAMFHTYAFVAETHMLKPYDDRVKATYALMESMIKTVSQNAEKIRTTRQQQKEWVAKSKSMAIDWGIDTAKSTMITLKGYEGGYKPSLISGQDRLYYDRSKPFTKKVPFHNTYNSTATVKVPQAYVILQGWRSVVEKLRQNGVHVRKLPYDSTVTVTEYFILNYETTPKPYEGHYLHSNVSVDGVQGVIKLRKGDFIVTTDQPAKRYIVETLEPEAPDAFFAWGYFDAILQQKEYYSAYVFEDLALELLEKSKALRDKLEEKKKADPEFAKDGRAQLHYIYQNSAYHEREHMRYPVFRLE